MENNYELDGTSLDATQLQSLSDDASSLLKEFLSSNGAFAKIDKNADSYLTQKELEDFIRTEPAGDRDKATAKAILKNRTELSFVSWDDALGFQVSRKDLAQLATKTRESVTSIREWDDMAQTLSKHLAEIKSTRPAHGTTLSMGTEEFSFPQLKAYIAKLERQPEQNQNDLDDLRRLRGYGSYLMQKSPRFTFNLLTFQSSEVLWSTPISGRYLINEANSAFSKDKSTLSLAHRFLRSR